MYLPFNNKWCSKKTKTNRRGKLGIPSNNPSLSFFFLLYVGESVPFRSKNRLNSQSCSIGMQKLYIQCVTMTTTVKWIHHIYYISLLSLVVYRFFTLTVNRPVCGKTDPILKFPRFFATETTESRNAVPLLKKSKPRRWWNWSIFVKYQTSFHFSVNVDAVQWKHAIYLAWQESS